MEILLEIYIVFKNITYKLIFSGKVKIIFFKNYQTKLNINFAILYQKTYVYHT